MFKVSEQLSSYYKKTETIPFLYFRKSPEKGFFFCEAGTKRILLTPDEQLWGCHTFPEYFRGKENSPEYKNFFFGYLDEFIINHKSRYPRIAAHYKKLDMNHFRTPSFQCFLCEELDKCIICPVNAAFTSGQIGLIPEFMCEMQKIKIEAKETFLINIS